MEQLKLAIHQEELTTASLKDKKLSMERTFAELKAANEAKSCSLGDQVTQRLETVTALEGLRAEAEAKLNSQQLVRTEQKIALNNQLAKIAREREEFLRERERVAHIKDEINRYKALISREERKPAVVTEEPVTEPLNRDRTSRLILLLLSEGAKTAIVQSLAEELNWTEKQAEEFTAAAKGAAGTGLGNEWADWLTTLADE